MPPLTTTTAYFSSRFLDEHCRDLVLDPHQPAVRRGVYHDISELIAVIEFYLEGYNERAQPFVWTKTAEQVIAKATKHQPTPETHGTVALLAALLVHTGEVKGNVYERNSRAEFLDFLELLEAEIPADKQVHAILDNLEVHKTPEVCARLEAHPRWHFHFTPTHASWLNQIELFFSILSRRLLRRGIFKSRQDLKAQLLSFIERYNPTAKPFAWTYQGKPLTK